MVATTEIRFCSRTPEERRRMSERGLPTPVAADPPGFFYLNFVINTGRDPLPTDCRCGHEQHAGACRCGCLRFRRRP